MKWFSLHIDTSPAGLEPVSTMLGDLGIDGLVIEDEGDFRRFLEQNRQCGTTVILTTHDMQDIDALCSRVLLIGKGQLLLDGTTAQIRCLAGENLSTEESVADLYRRFGI